MYCNKISLWDRSFKLLSLIACCSLLRSANIGVIRKFWSSFMLSVIIVTVDALQMKILGLSTPSLRHFEVGLLLWLVLSLSFLKVSKIVADWLRLVSPNGITYLKQLESVTPNIHVEDDLLYPELFHQIYFNWKTSISLVDIHYGKAMKVDNVNKVKFFS